MKQVSAFHAAAMAMAISFSLSPVLADWPGIHFDATNNAAIPSAATVVDLGNDQQHTTTPNPLSTAIRPIIAGSNVYTVATESSPADRIWIRAFDKTNLGFVADSADLDTGISVSYGTASAPLADTANNALYFATGSTMYRLNLADLTSTGPAWSTVMSDSNTAPAATYTVLNASPALGDGKVYIKTYPTAFGNITDAQTVAFDTTTGAVAWYSGSGGRGTSSPLYLEAGPNKLVIVDYQPTSNNVGLQAFDAASTGAATPVWTTATTYGAGGFHGVWGDMVAASGKVYAVTTDVAFPGPSSGHLLKVDAATGTVEQNVAIIGTDIPPIIIGGVLHVLHEDGNFVRYSTADLSTIGSPASFGGATFRNYMAATTDSIYIAQDGIGIRKFDLAGSLQSSSIQTDFRGPLAIDSTTGHLYVHSDFGLLNLVTGVAKVSDWAVID